MAFEFDASTARRDGEFDPSTATLVPSTKTGFARAQADRALSLGQGIATGVKSLVDIGGADTSASKALGGISEGIEGLYSPGRIAEKRERARITEEADKSGSQLDQVTARLGGFAEAPLQSVLQGIGSMAPTLATAVATRGRGLAATMPAIGGAQGVGAVKGGNYDAVKAEALNRGMDDATAEQMASKAAEYSIENLPQQALGGVLGAVAGGTGAERIVSGIAGGAGAGLLRRVARGAATEAIPEGAQGAQGQYAQNEALNRAGFQTDPWAGVAGAGVHDATVGAVIGGGFGVRGGQPAKPPPPPPPQSETPAEPAAPATPEVIRAQKLPETGPLSGSWNAGVEAKAQETEASTPTAPLPADGATIWRNADIDIPVTVDSAPPERGPDGRMYQSVFGPDGKRTFVPADELVHAAATPAIDPAAPNAVAQHIQRMRATNTPAARAYVQDFEAGRITPQDVLAGLVPQRTEPTADTRLAAAAAQAPTVQPGDLLASTGKPFGTRAAAGHRARKADGTVIQVENGYVVRPKEARNEPVVGVQTAAPEVAGAGAAGGPVVQRSGGVVGVDQPAAPGRVGGAAAAPAVSGTAPEPVADGGKPVAALTPQPTPTEAAGLKPIPGMDNEWGAKLEPGPNVAHQFNLRRFGGGVTGNPVQWSLKRTTRFPGTGVTGAPTMEVGRFNSETEALEAFAKEKARLDKPKEQSPAEGVSATPKETNAQDRTPEASPEAKPESGAAGADGPVQPARGRDRRPDADVQSPGSQVDQGSGAAPGPAAGQGNADDGQAQDRVKPRVFKSRLGATKAERDKRAADQERLRKEAETRDLNARADATVDAFELGQDANAQMSGMGDMFADAPAAPSQAAQSAAPAAAPVDWEARMHAAMKADGATLPAAEGMDIGRAKALRKQADKLQDEARNMLAGIPAGQPVGSTRDANLREKAREKSLKAGDLHKQADDMDRRLAESAAQSAAETAARADRDVSPLQAFKDTMRDLYDGTAPAEVYRAAYKRVRDESEVKAELGKMTKDELIRTFGILRDGKKDELVDIAYDSMVRAFALGKEYGPSSWSPFQDGGFEGHKKIQAEALDALVEGQTEEDLAQYAAENKAAREERASQRAALRASIENPQTLQEFRDFFTYHQRQGKTFDEARMMLTPEQRATADELSAIESRGRRKDTTDERRTSVNVAGQKVDAKIVETKHTQKGYDIFVVQLAERVAREDYDTLNASAKRMGGYYSSFRGRGAVPGFQFRDMATADAFVKLANGDAGQAQEAAQARRDAFEDDRSQSAVQRLTEMADRLDERADESLSRERKANTARRAGQAASAEGAARADKALAGTMRNIAASITGGTTKFLERVRQKVQVELLHGIVRTAKDAEIRTRYESYAEQEKHKGEPPTGATADHAQFPSFTAYRSDLASLGRQLLEVDGTKLLGQQIMKVADDVSDAYLAFAKDNFFKVGTFSNKAGGVASFGTRDAAEAAIKRSGYKGKAIAYQVKRGEHTVIMSPSEAIARNIWKGDGDKRITLTSDFGAEMVEKIGRANRRGAKVSVPWQFETAYDRRKQLTRMGIETPQEFRAALREFIGLREQAAAPDKVKQLERAMVGRRNDGLDFFPTPAETADQMVEAAGIEAGMRVLEPSAGMGHIADRIRAAGIEPEVGEIASDRRDLLEAKGFNVVAHDFTEFTDANHDKRSLTYGDVFSAPDGTLGVLRGSGGMGSDRVGLEPLDENGQADARRSRWENFGDLEPVERRGVGSGYDRILMNPPFSDGRDIVHVRHAFALLKPGGRLVALMGESAFTNQNKRATEFREWLETVGGTEEKLAEGAFNDPSLPVNTGANARMVVIEKGQAADDAMLSRASQTDSKAFQDWFGNSKVVGPDGSPLVVHHGTNKSFDAFDTQAAPQVFESDRGLFFFTSSAAEASQYASGEAQVGRATAGANVMPVYVSAKSPHVETYSSNQALSNYLDDNRHLLDYARGEYGHDGLIVRNTRTGETLVVVSRPEQIKSATGNRGTFDPESADIRFDRAIPRVTIETDADTGIPAFAGSGIRLSYPQVTERFEIVTGKNEQVVNYAIMPAEGLKVFGYVELLVRDGKPVSVLDIEVNDKGSGIGKKVIETLLAADPGADLNISNIVEGARGFWAKMGVPEQNLEPGAAYEGTLNWQTYSQAQNARAAQSLGAGNGRSREERLRRGEGQGREPAGEGQTTGLTTAEAAAIMALPEATRNRLLGRTLTADRVREMAAAMAPHADVRVVQSVDDMPASERSRVFDRAPSGAIRGVYFRGDDRIWLVADQLHSEAEAAFVLLHEAFHRGLAKTIGPEAKRLLNSMYATNANLRELTKQQMKAHGIGRDEAIEEALADLAGKGEARELRGWDRLIAMVRGWLSKVGRQLGLRLTWTDDMVADFVAGAARAGLAGDVLVNQAEGLAASRRSGIISVKQIGDRWVVVRNEGTGNAQHLGYYGSESEANEAAERARIEPGRGSGRGAAWWVENRSQLVQSTGLGRLDSLGRQRAVNATLNARSAAVKSADEGLSLQQDPRRAGYCYRTATEASASGVGDMVIGWASFVDGGWHAVVTRDGMIYDPTMARWFEPGVYEAMGFQARKTLTSEQVKEFISKTRGLSPDARNQGLLDDQPRDEMGRFSRAIPDWVSAGNPALKAAAGKIDTYAPTKPIAEKLREMSAGWKDRLVQGMLDAYAPLKKLSMDAYTAARMTKAADGAFEGMLLHGKPVMTADGGIRGDLDGAGFLGAMKELGGEHDRFFMWLAGNRAERLLSEGKENLFTADEIAAMKDLNRGQMADGKSRAAAFAKAHAQFNAYSKSVLDVAEQSGLIDGESRSMWERDFYVPFYRVGQDSEISGPSKIKGLVRQQAFEKLKGGKENLGDLMENTLRNWSHLLSASLANVAASKSLQAAEGAGIAFEAKEATAKEMAKAAGLKGNAVYFMDKGEQRWFVVEDQAVLTAVSALEAPALSGLPLQIMGKFKRYLTIGVTIAPAFKIRNLIRDTLAAPAANEMSYNIPKNLAQGWKGTDTKTDAYAQMLFSGALMKFGTFLEGDRAEHVKRLIADGVDAGTILNNPQKVKAALGKLWDAWQGFGDRMENINRTALYQQLIAKGVSPRDAAFQARDMMDFSLQGAWAGMRTLNAVVPFLNARAQGLYKLGRAAQENPRRMGYMVAAVSLVSIALMLANEDDDDWKAREDWDRDGFWWFKIGDTAFRIPKPFELGAMGTIAERSVELMINDEMTGKRFAERMKQMVLDTFAMNPVPQLFKPLVDLYANKDSFTGRQIETLGMERLSKSERYGPNTSALAKALGAAGEYTGVSPVQVDHMIRAYFGWLGVQATATVDAMVAPFDDKVRPAVKLEDFSGGFVKALPAAQSRYIEDFYKQAKATSEVMADLRRARESGDIEKAASIAESERSKLAQYRLYQHAERQMSEINKQIRIVRDSDRFDAQGKREQIDALTATRNRLAKTISDRTRSLQAAH